MAERLGKGIKRYFKDNLGILCALAAMILFLYIWPTTHSTFLTQRNIFNVLRQSAPNLLLACGMTMVIILGGIDLSVGSIIAMSGVLGAAAVVWWGLPEIAGILIGILSGVIFGLFNGAIIAKTQIPPFIVTLGTMKIFRSVTQYFMQSQPGITLPDGFKQIARAVRAPVLNSMLLPIFYWLLLAAVLHVVSKHTAFGRYVYAVGSNERTTRLSGINVDRVKRRVYALMGLIVAMASVVQIARIGSMDYASAGSGYEMDAIAAVVIGGTSMSGGRGSIVGTLLGTLIIAVMNNLLTLVGVDPFLREAFKGAIVVAAVLMQRKESSN